MSELIYCIDKILSEKEGMLVIKIENSTSKDRKGPKTKSYLLNLTNLRDEQALAWLIQEEMKFQKKTLGRIFNEANIDFSTIHIPYSLSTQALKQLATTGKVYFNQRQLVLDLYTKVEFYYSVTLQSGQPVATGQIMTKNESFNLCDCDFICGGDPHWFIKGMLLQTIQTELSWPALKRAFYEPSKIVINEIKEDAEEDVTAPRVLFQENSIEAIQQISQPLPQLVLKDRTGAFAELWMNYGNGLIIPFHQSHSGVKALKRDLKAEASWEKDLLETGFTKKLVGTSQYYCPLDKVGKSLAFLLEIGWTIIDYRENRVVQHTETVLSMSAENQVILLKGKVSFDDYEADVSEVVGAFNRKERFLQLGEGIVGLIPNSLEEASLGGLSEDGEIVGDTVRIKQSNIGSISHLLESSTSVLDDTLRSLKERINDFQKVAIKLPGDAFVGKLRPYQQDGLNWLGFLYDFGFHGILADDMGLGKTIQVLAFLSQLTSKNPTLIVLPTSLLFNWKKEIEKFLPGWEVYLHHGTQRLAGIDLIPRNGIILTSYTTLRLDLPLLSQIPFECVILDEAQAIKNASTQIAQAACNLRAKMRLSITGTPIENSLNEMWSHFRFLMPELLGTEQDFNAEVKSAGHDNRYLKRIRKKLKPFILRRKKSEVAKDLPEKIEQVIWVELGPEQRKIYDDFLSGVRGNLIKKIDQDGLGKHRMEVLEAILRLRQICCHPLLVTSQFENPVDQSSKLEALLLDIETTVLEGRKALVYSQFTGMLSLIVKEVKNKGWKYVYLDGSTVNREEVVTNFQEDPEISLFLISLKAGGIGLNLTSADYVFLYDPWWNEAVENQAINRAHRIGRQETVIAKRYIAIETIEEKIMKLKASKRSLVEDVLDGDLSGALTEEDFRFLLTT